jgi:N-glycosidase YbiA
VDRTIIFYRSDPPAVSPQVSVNWPGKVVDLFNRFPADVWFNRDTPEGRCVDFVAACCADGGYADPTVGTAPSGLWNLPLRWDRPDELQGEPGTREYAERWRTWLFEEIERLSAEAGGRWLPPVLVDLDPPYHATQGGKVLCRRARADEYEPGKPLWVQVDRAAVVTFSRYGTEYGEFSNFAPYPVKIDRRMWPSAEDYFQAQKFEDKVYREKIRKADSVMIAARLHQDREQKVRPDWESVKVEVMRAAVLAKFTQYEELRELLLSTDDAELVGETGNNNWGGDGGDKNLLGRVLMEVRAQLRAAKAASPAAAPKRRGKTARGGRSPAAPPAGERGGSAAEGGPEAGAYRTFIFYRPDLSAISPAVRVRWPGKIVELFNRLRPAGGGDPPAGWYGGGNVPDGWCVDFVAACCATPQIGAGGVELHNLPLRWDLFSEQFDDRAPPSGTPEFDKAFREWEDAWRKRLSKEIRRVFAPGGGGEELPVLVDTLSPCRATQGGKVVFRQAIRDEYGPDAPIWVEPGSRARPKRTPARPAARPGGPGCPVEIAPESPLTPYGSYTVEEAVAAFGDPAAAQFYCDRQFAVVRKATLCFATMGDPETGTKVQSPSLVVWKPGRLDYHPKAETPWFPSRLTKCVERNGGYVPLHHMFLRATGDGQFVYAGIAELPMLGDMSEGGRVQQVAQFFLDAKLPRDLWVRLGGYDWLVGFNNTPQRFAADDLAGFERLLAGFPTTAGHWQVTLTGYEEWRFAVLFNANRAYLSYRPLHFPYKLGDESGVESRDPDCPQPRRREFFGEGVVVPARRTVPRELAVRAAVEHFRTGRQPECVRWRKIKGGGLTGPCI